MIKENYLYIVLETQYKKLFEIDGVTLEIEDDALRAIAQKALNRKTGARGLRGILEKAMLETMFDVPSDEEIVKVVITKESIENDALPVVIRDEIKEDIPTGIA